MDRLAEMEAFAAVVDQGGFTGAAQKLGISKSAVSKHVSSLETRLGARLLNRTTRRVNPTEIGLVYYDRARSVLTAALEADAAVGDLKADPSGTLQILCPADFGSTILAPLVTRFLDRHEGVDINLVLNGKSSDMERDDVDLCFSVGSKPESALTSHKLDTVTRHLVASPEYLDTHGVPRRIEDLSQHSLLHYADTAAEPHWSLVSQTGETRVVRTKGRLTTNCGHCLTRNAVAGMGIALLPDYLVEEDLAKGVLRDAMPSLPPQTTPLYVAYPPSRAALPRVRGFLEFLITTFSEPQVPSARAIA